ncbi:3-oxoacyl-reductase [Mycena capillaripes]|nr:3-oxoacyl-reductase [Mycena capillaripes]
MPVSTVFVTGASSGIGLAAAKLFHAKGWNVIATMRNPDSDTELRQLDSNRMVVLRLDVQDLGAIAAAVEEGIKKFARIDLLLNNAGYGQNGLFEMVSREQIQEQFNVNLFGLMDVTRTLLPHFRANKGGGVIMVSSGGGFYGLPMISIYNASKFALEGFTESLAFELASHNIFVKSVVPNGGVTSTNFSSRPIAMDPALVPSYEEFMKKTGDAYRSMISGRSISSEDVAQVIYTAATDGKDKLRYMVGADAAGFLKARQGDSDGSNDEKYISVMREHFK